MLIEYLSLPTPGGSLPATEYPHQEGQQDDGQNVERQERQDEDAIQGGCEPKVDTPQADGRAEGEMLSKRGASASIKT